MTAKRVVFQGSSLADLRAFPQIARHKAGYQIDRVQKGLEPNDFKPISNVGKSVYEIRVEVSSGAFRVIYIANFESVVYVLHCFQKKTQKTAKRDIELAKNRYRALRKECEGEK